MVKAADEHKSKVKLEAAVKRVDTALDALAKLKLTKEQHEEIEIHLRLKASITLSTLKSTAHGGGGFRFGGPPIQPE